MNPYYQDASVTIYHGDCRDIFPSLAIPDIVIADPPYGETRHKWDRWPAGWPNLISKVPSFWCWGSLRMFFEHLPEFAKYNMAQDLVWEKQNGTGMHNDRFRRVHEFAVQFYPKGRKWSDVYHKAIRVPSGTPKRIIRHAKPAHWGQVNASTYVMDGTRLLRSVIRAKNGHRAGIHASAKPLVFSRAFAQYSCPPGGTLCSLFMGGGGDLIAAKELGRKAVGIDMDERTCEAAAKRMSQGVFGL